VNDISGGVAKYHVPSPRLVRTTRSKGPPKAWSRPPLSISSL